MARDVSWRTPKRRLFSTPVPEETRTYKPVSHKQLAKATLQAIKDAGFELGVEEYYSAKEGLVATARYTINDVRDEDMQLEIGWQNSYDKTLSLKFAIGTRIMICENGCVSGNFGSFARKHMADIQTFAPDEMKESILSAAEIFNDIKRDKDIMKTYIIGKDKQFELAGKLFFVNDAFGSTQLNIVNEQIKRPSFDYGAEGSIWEIYQHVTFAMRELHPRLWMEAHIEIHQYFLEEVLKEKEQIRLQDRSINWQDFVSVANSKGFSGESIVRLLQESSIEEIKTEIKGE